jgi:Glycosyltransferase family 87
MSWHGRAILFAIALASALIVIITNVQHDYIYYLDQWRLVLSGADPWSGNNAYGPLHNAFAPLILIDPLLPKLFDAGALVLAGTLLARALAARPISQWDWIFALALWANALVLVSALVYGLNDTFVAALVIAAVLARHKDRVILAGVLLGLATLDKYYPALLIPFFAIDRRVVAPRLILGALITIALGLVAATLIWQTEWLEAVRYGISRDATILSILKPITVLGRANGFGDLVDAFVRFNGPLVLLVWLGAVGLAWWRRDRWLTAATWGLFVVLLTYKVGNPQFWICWLALVACLPLLDDVNADRLARLSLPYALFLTLFEIGYAILVPHYYQGDLHWVTDWVGLVSFALGLWMLFAYFVGSDPNHRVIPAKAGTSV